MPNRVIREVGLTSLKLAAISDFGERLYWRIYQAVDDFGRYYADPEILRARCFPKMLRRVSSRKVQNGRNELSRVGLMLLYRNGEDEILQITKFDQRVRATKSKFPPPDDGHVTVIPPSDDGLDRGSRIEDRGSRIEARDKGAAPNPGADRAPGFEQFWKAYPRKVKKPDAEKAWRQTEAARPELELILAAIETFRRSEDWRKDRGRFIPYPATWLRAHQWQDSIEGQAVQEDDEFMRRNRERMERDRKLLADQKASES